MGPIARGQITLVDLSDIISQSTAPTNPTEGMLWMNTGVTPPVLMVYRGGKWVLQNDFKDDPEYNIIKETIKTNTSGIDVLKDEIKLKVSQTEVTNTVITEINKVQIGGTNFLSNTTNKMKSVTFKGWDHYLQTLVLSDYNLKAGDELTARIYLKPTVHETKVHLDFRNQTETAYSQHFGNIIKVGEEGYSTLTIKIPATTGNGQVIDRVKFSIRHSTSVTTDNTVQYREPKLEKGTKATDWSPAPQDSETKITEINSQISDINIGLGQITTKVETVESAQITQDKYLSKNKWLVQRYNKQLSTNRAPEFGDLVGIVPVEQYELLDTMTLIPTTTSWDYRIYSFTTNVYVETSKGVSFTATSDDGISVFLNGDFVSSRAGSGSLDFNLSLQQGWNNVNILYYEHSGTERLSLNKKLSDNVNLMSYTQGDTDSYSRLKAAEQKITDTAIINTVKNSQTNGKDTFVQTSALEQTADSITAEFKSSGGNNLLLNSNAKNGTNYWSTRVYNVVPNSGITNSFRVRNDSHSGNEQAFEVYVNGAMTSGEIGMYQNITTVIGKQYVLTGYLAGHRSNKNIVIRGTTASEGEWLTSKTYGDITGGTTLSNWTKIEIPFVAQRTTTTIELDILRTNPTTLVDGYLWAKQLMVIEGKDWRPWQPNASEIYDGITTINKDGIKVNSSNANTYTQMSASGFYIKKNDGTSLLTADSTGLSLTGKITVTSGSNVDAGISQEIKDQINQSAKEIYDGTFNFGKSYWSDSYIGENTNATTKGTVVKDGFDGGNVLQFTSSTWLYSKNPIAIDVNRKYRMRFRVRKTVAGTGAMRVYAGVATLDKNLNNLSGGAGTHRYCAASGRDIPTSNDWTVFEGVITGTGDAANNFRTGTCYVRPMFIVNYDNGTGTTQVDMISFEDITDSKNAQDTADSAQSTANSANSTANTVNNTVNAGKVNWDNAYNNVRRWAYNGAVTGSTTIDGGLIQTNTILAEKIAIGDFTNYVSDPSFEEGIYTNSGTFTITTERSRTGTKCLKMAAGTGSYASYPISRKIAVRNGDRLYVEWWQYRLDATTGASVDIAVYNNDGTVNTYDIQGNIVPSATDATNNNKWVKYSYVGAVNTDGYAIAIVKHRVNTNLVGNYYFDDITVRKMATGELIVDGSITTDKITANGISADKIKTGSITSTNGKSVFNLNDATFQLGATTDPTYLRYTGGALELKGKMTISSGSDLSEANIGSTNLYTVKDGTPGYYLDSNGNLATSSIGYVTSGYVNIDKAFPYTIQVWVVVDAGNPNAKVQVAFYKDGSSSTGEGAKVKVGTVSVYDGPTVSGGGRAYLKVLVKDIPSDAQYIRFSSRYLIEGKAKLEKGDVGTDWSPSPIDIDTEFSNLSDLTNEIQGIANDAKTILDQWKTVNTDGTVQIDGGNIKAGTISAKAIDTKGLIVLDEAENVTFEVTGDGNVSIDGTLHSTYYGDDHGYRITRDGSAMFNQATIRGDILLPNAGMTNYGGQIGNENLLLNTNFLKTTTGSGTTSKNPNNYPTSWGGYNGGITNPTTNYHAHIDNDTFGYNVVEFNESDGTRHWKGISQSLTTEVRAKIDGSSVYTISFDAYSTIENAKVFGGFYFTQVGGTTQSFHAGQFTKSSGFLVNQWERISLKVPINTTIDISKGINVYIYGYGFGSNGILYIKNVKLEQSEKATPWCLAASEQSGDHTRIWAGTTYADRDKASFRVTQDGKIFATSGTFSGNVESSELHSGRIHIHNNEIFIDNSSATLNMKTGNFDMMTPRGVDSNPLVKLSPSLSMFNNTFVLGTADNPKLKFNGTNVEVYTNLQTFSGGITNISYNSEASADGGLNIIANSGGARHVIRNSNSTTRAGQLIFDSQESQGYGGIDYVFTRKNFEAETTVKVEGSFVFSNEIKGTGHSVTMRNTTTGFAFYSN